MSIGWIQRQQILDSVSYYQYSPTPAVEEIAKDAELTDPAMFTFYASHPKIELSKQFNQHCQRKEADSPILGCYSAGRIYIFDVTDERLEGIKVVTAAHELLHAVYERLPDSEKNRLKPLLEAEYKKISDSDLQVRMKYYEKTEPGESINELHSIIGTEYGSLSPELEEYYGQFFKDRTAIVSLHIKVERVFDNLSEEADNLVDQIELLASRINSATRDYNADINRLSAEVRAFNQRAQRTGGFTTQSEFEAARAELVQESDRLNAVRQDIESDVATYKSLLAKLDAINTESSSLNQSLDSTLSDVPTI